MCKRLDLEFIPAGVWEGLWFALFTVIFAPTKDCAICYYVTHFNKDVFSALISLIFIVGDFKYIGGEFDKRSREGAFFTVTLARGTFGLAMYCRALRSSGWLTKAWMGTIATLASLFQSCSLRVFQRLQKYRLLEVFYAR